jgi:hypothetical protein
VTRASLMLPGRLSDGVLWLLMELIFLLFS